MISIMNEDEIERGEGRRKPPKKLNRRRKGVNDELGEDGNEEGEEDEELEGEDDLKRNYPMGKGGKNRNRGRGNSPDVGLNKGNKLNRNAGKRKPNRNNLGNQDDFNDDEDDDNEDNDGLYDKGPKRRGKDLKRGRKKNLGNKDMEWTSYDKKCNI